MKRIIIAMFVLCCLLLTACHNINFGIIGGSDGPTNIIVPEKKNETSSSYNAEKYFKENYINENKLPMLDIDMENPFVSDDRTLILDDSIDNSIELMIYEYYKSIMSGSYKEAKDMIVDGSLLAATEASENNFKEGIYYSKIVLDEIELIDKDDLDKITHQNKQAIIDLLSNLNMKEFAIVEVEKAVKHNQRALSMAPQVGDGDVTRYFLLGKSDDTYKIIEVYWEGFIND